VGGTQKFKKRDFSKISSTFCNAHFVEELFRKSFKMAAQDGGFLTF
jgi:hypothetical protein